MQSFGKSCLLFLSLGMAGCTPNLPAGDTPVPGTGPAITQDNMPAYCQSAAAIQYGTTMGAVSTDPAVQAGGGFEVKGTSSGGSQGGRVFNCRFNSSGKLLGVFAGNGAG